MLGRHTVNCLDSKLDRPNCILFKTHENIELNKNAPLMP